MMLRTKIFVAALAAMLLPVAGFASETAPVAGLAENTPSDYALVGAKIVVAPGRTIESGTIVIRDGRIESVAAGEQVPDGVRRVDLKGHVVYAGLIDSYTKASTGGNVPGPGYWNSNIAPQTTLASTYNSDAGLNKKLRSQGVVARLVAPTAGVIQGQSALVLTSDQPSAEAVVIPSAGLHIRLTVPFGHGRREYPSSPMGAVALARQAFYDAAWYEQASAVATADSSIARPELNTALDSLAGYLDGQQLVLADVSNEMHALRADRFAREFSLRLAIVGSGLEYRRLDEIRDTRRVIIVPVDFPKPPKVASPSEALSASLEELMHWKLAPENPGRLAGAGVKIAFSSEGLSDRGQLLAGIRKSVEHGLGDDDALRALTTAPAKLFGVDSIMGSVEKGKLANLVVTDGPLFDKKTKIVSTWVAGKQHLMKEKPVAEFQGKWTLKTTKKVAGTKEWMLEVKGKPEKPSATISIPTDDERDDEEENGDEEEESDDEEDDKSPSIDLKPVSVSGYQLTGNFAGEKFELDGKVTLSATLTPSGDESLLTGLMILADGKRIAFEAKRATDDEDEEKEPDDEDKKDDEAKPADEKATENKDEESDKQDNADDQPRKVAVNFPLGTYGVTEPPAEGLFAFTGATVWTCGESGILKEATIVVDNGTIVAVGTDVEIPEGAKVIDCKGKHVTPGIIDCHSHMATDGGINETGQAVTAEVRIGDTIDCDDITIYRQLAGGVTTSNILHGSANPIGGQNQVIKLRWGATAEQMKFAGAPAGIKFALGENVKQSNWGERFTSRYPQSRMGVDELMIDQFRAAQEYQAKWERWEADPVGMPPRRDLQLDAIVEILEQKRWIHCHSYRQSEILALLRTLEKFNVRIGTLQHILEGYKVAPEMAAHGAMASSFSDWWGYKFEVYDAIAFNGALMHKAGIVVSFNSDDWEMGRRLNQEAAKATKYGGVPPEEALKFVTLNAAKQLRIDQHVGSLETGKQADLVVWSSEPMSTFSRCEQTWIDGRQYFSLKQDGELRKRDEKLRADLIQAVLTSGDKPAKKGENRSDPSLLWPRIDEYCAGKVHKNLKAAE